MNQRVITISREFGSGGRTIGKKVADRLNLPCYDSQLILKIAKESGVDAEYVKNTGENFSGGFLSVLSGRAFGPNNGDYLWKVQCRVIVDLAKEGPCVIVGRCADYVLRGKADCLKVFIHADPAFRAERIVKVYGESDCSSEQRIRGIDIRKHGLRSLLHNLVHGQKRSLSHAVFSARKLYGNNAERIVPGPGTKRRSAAAGVRKTKKPYCRRRNRFRQERSPPDTKVSPQSSGRRFPHTVPDTARHDRTHGTRPETSLPAVRTDSGSR